MVISEEYALRRVLYKNVSTILIFNINNSLLDFFFVFQKKGRICVTTRSILTFLTVGTIHL